MSKSFRSLVDGLQIRCGYFAIHAHSRRARQFVVQRNIQMAAPHAFAHDLADARLDRLETFRHAQMEIEKAVIHAAHGNAQAPAIFDDARLRVPRHRFECRFESGRGFGDWTCCRTWSYESCRARRRLRVAKLHFVEPRVQSRAARQKFVVRAAFADRRRLRAPRSCPRGESSRAGARSRIRCGRSSDYSARSAPAFPIRNRAPRWPRRESGSARPSAARARSPGAAAGRRRDAGRDRQSRSGSPAASP